MGGNNDDDERAAAATAKLISDLKIQRGVLKGQQTKMKTYIEEKGGSANVFELETKLDLLETYFEKFQKVQSKLECTDSAEVALNERERFEDTYFEIKSSILSLKNLHQNRNSVPFNTTIVDPNCSQIRVIDHIEKLKLPSFSGNMTEWLDFWSVFQVLVHECERYTDAEKFQHLRNCLIGDAREIIRGMDSTAKNYTEAIKLLQLRFDNRRYVFQAHINAIFELQAISKPSTENLRYIIDRIKAHLRSLLTIGKKEQIADGLLLHIFATKLDFTTRAKWEEEISKANENTTESSFSFPTWEEFSTFLEKRLQTLKFLQSTKDQPLSSTTSTRFQQGQPKFKPKSGAGTTSLVSSTVQSTTTCPNCKAEHFLFQCPSFREMNVIERRALVKRCCLCFNCLRGDHISRSCKSKQSCQNCGKRHHTLVHALPVEGAVGSQRVLEQLTPEPKPEVITNYSVPGNCFRRSLLPTIIGRTPDHKGEMHSCRILLDSGSQVSFVTEAFAKKLGIPRQHARISITGLSSIGAGTTRGVVSLHLFSRFHDNYSLQINAFILQKLTPLLPNWSFNISNWDYINTLPLADPTFHTPGPIDILLGADKLFHILQPDRIDHNSEYPTAQLTKFGWVLAGEIPHHEIEGELYNYHSSTVSNFSEIDIDKTLRKFWEIEENHQALPLTQEEQMAEDHFVQTHARSTDGRYILELPFRQSTPNVGDSMNVAIRRLYSMEKRFCKNEQLRIAYSSFMNQYLALGHMERIPEKEALASNIYYLPHHAVFKSESTTTKLRVVFDGSCQPPSGQSLNQALLIGPPILRDLFSICVRFRQHRLVLTADIEKMYRQILIAKRHREYQRIVWRDSPDKPIEHFRLRTVTYGTSSAPFLALRTLHQLAVDYEDKYPVAARILQTEFYMDDVMTGAETVEELISLKRELVHILNLGGFQLRKWSTNCKELLLELPEEECELSPLEFDDDSISIKVLGLRWNPSADVFSYKVAKQTATAITKRQILSISSRIFDPLGFLSPFIISIKTLLQRLWLQQLGWDEEIGGRVAQEWVQLRDQMKDLELVKVPRRIWNSKETYDIHAFCDASEEAFATVIYARSPNLDGTYDIELIAAKTRVAPLKQISLPRLELCGAVLLCRLLEAIFTALGINPVMVTAWTDSKIVLQWLSSTPRRWKTFVANRTAEVLELIPRNKWRHIPSTQNPADCASRGIPASDLVTNQLWWNGPTFLRNHSSTWPKQDSLICTIDDLNTEIKGNCSITTLVANASNPIIDELLGRVSSWTRLIRIIAYCYRWMKGPLRSSGGLKTLELKRAQTMCFKAAQTSMYLEDIRSLDFNKKLPKKSKLIKLRPFLDQDGVLRVGGRLENSSLSYNARHPIILPKGHPISELLLKHHHEKYLHASVNELFVFIKQQFWIIGCRNMLRKLIHNCIICFRQRTTTSCQLMGNLPYPRVQYARPFARVGIDYAGPLNLRSYRGRNSRQTKGYIALFVCFTTKALHLEAVSDLTSDAFLAAFKRFVSRRGKCSDVYSDNGTNFKGAQRSLCEMKKLLLSQVHNDLIVNHLAQDGITWHFIPPGAPHFGGLWEAGVKSVKLHLRRVIGNHLLTFEELSTLLTEIEAILNSRPLCSSSDTELDPLTPAHFLIGCSLTAIPEPDVTSIPTNRLSNWQLLQNLKQGFWKRWHTEYLTSLQQRSKWNLQQSEVSEGDLVVLKEDHLPPAQWILARIVKKHPGKDGLTRVVTVRTSKGSVTRPICKIAPLPKN